MGKQESMSKKKDKKKQKESSSTMRPVVTYYDKDGNVIGDDGYLMTPVRKRMHTLCNALFVWGVIVLLWAVFCGVFANFQNQEYHSFDSLIGTGGTQFHGWDLAMLLRFEGLFGLFVGVMMIISHLVIFRWFYDGAAPRNTRIILGVIGVPCVVFLILAFVLAQVPDPISIGSLVLIAVIVITMQAVIAEKPTLKKAEVASKVVK